MTVTRDDLSLGYRAVQSTHAGINFTFEHPDRAGPWFHNSNYLIQKVVENEEELKNLINKCERKQLAITVFREPDIGDQITAIAIEASVETERLVKHLPLLFSKESKINQNEKQQYSIEDLGNQGKDCKSNQERLIQEEA